jgi:hypothetical protein
MRSWPLKACGVLLAVYGCSWAASAVAVLVLLFEVLQRRSPGFGISVVLVAFLLLWATVLAAACWGLAVGLWRGSQVAHVVAIVAAGVLSMALTAAIGSEALQYVFHTVAFDPGLLMLEVATLAGGPGVILVLLLLPSSWRALWRGVGSPTAPGTLPGS